MTQLKPTELSSELAPVQWPDPLLHVQFMHDVLEQSSKVDAETIKRWVWLIGKPSQFLGRKAWTVEDCIEHYKALDLYLAEEQEAKEIPPASTAPAPAEPGKPAESALELAVKAEKAAHAALVVTASEEWHKAVEARRVALKTSSDWTRDEVARLKAAHTTLSKRWNDYVESKRQAFKNLR